MTAVARPASVLQLNGSNHLRKGVCPISLQESTELDGVFDEYSDPLQGDIIRDTVEGMRGKYAGGEGYNSNDISLGSSWGRSCTNSLPASSFYYAALLCGWMGDLDR